MLPTLKTTLARRRESGTTGDEGFTLIELMVVVGIIAILLAIAIPTFLASRGKAQEKSAQSSLRNTLTAAKSIYVESNDYTKATTGSSGTLEASEPSLTFNATGDASTGPTIVSVSSTANTFFAAAKADNGTCYAIKDSSAGTQFSTLGATCTGTAAAASSGVTWNAKW